MMSGQQEQQKSVKGNKSFLLEKRWSLTLVLAGLIFFALLSAAFFRPFASTTSLLCSFAGLGSRRTGRTYDPTPTQLRAIIHYATSRVVPQQSYNEISVSFKVLKDRAPCNFLVFGLGRDSLMWAALNPNGRTLFLEEDPEWYKTVTKSSPDLHAYHVHYRTQLKEADALIRSYRSERECSPERAHLRGNTRCKLALTGLPDEVYDTEWDLIMVDAPKGYFPEAPGRMGAIYSASVMAMKRKGPGSTHVFLHDVDRKVEKRYAEEFLCRKFRVGGSGRLWHFEIPPETNVSRSGGRFC